MLTRRSLLGAATAALSIAGTAAFRGASAAAAADVLKGKILYKGVPDYEAAREAAVWNGRKPDRYPEAIVMAENADDVAAAVKLAKRQGWQVGTRSGGHSWVGSSVRDHAVLINISRLRELSVDPVTRIATVSPAWQGQAFNQVLRDRFDLMFPSGHCYGVGLGGFLLAGGHGWNSRVWGPACAQLVALDLINADGDLVHASELENTDYLWAARGAGAGFPGVAVRFYVKTFPRPHAMKYSGYTYPEESLDEVLTWYGQILPEMPKCLESFVRGALVDGKPVVKVIGNAIAYSEAEADAALDLLDSCPALGKVLAQKRKVATIFPADAESPTTPSPTGARYVTDGVWTNASTAEIIARTRPYYRDFPSKETWYLWMGWGDVQALPDMAYTLQGHSYLSPNAVWYDPADDEKCAQWALRSIDAVREIAVGGQMNDDNMAINHLPYLSSTAETRLKLIQAKFDPQHRFAGFLLKT